MSYTALYREWRPKTFQEVVGQEHITRTLKNALALNRVAHAYIFTGPRGTGKTSIAKILAKAVNCRERKDNEPCSRCPTCESITNGTSMDVIEIDAASNRGIAEIRDLREKVRYSPAECSKKVYIVDEVHMLTPEAFNALLKTLEEPPAHALFVLATTEPHKVPATILSRCQRFDFHRLSQPEIVERLHKVADTIETKVSSDALDTIARSAEGSLRDALGLLDQCVAYAESHVEQGDVLEVLGRVGHNVVFEVSEAISQDDAASALTQINHLSRQGVDLTQFISDLQEHFRDLLVLISVKEPDGLVDIAHDELETCRRQALRFGKARLLDALDLLAKANNDIRYSGRPQMWLEVFAIKVARGRPAEMTGAVDTAPDEDSSSMVDSPPDTCGTKATVDLKRLLELWPNIMAEVRRTHIPLHALLLDAKPEAMEDDKLILRFGMEFHKNTMEKESNLRLLEQILQKSVGRKLRVACCMMGEAYPEGSSGSDDPSTLDLVLDTFGGEVVNVKDPREGG